MDGALADYEQAIAVDPRLADAYYSRGIVLCDKNDLQKAIADYTRAIELNPRFAAAYGNRGLVRLRLGLHAEAEKDFAKCLQLDSTLKSQLDGSIQSVKQLRLKQ
jgi:tetratricopeptide (TPR) repeat protein